LVPAAAVYSSSEFAREFGPSSDAGDVMNRLSGMMGAAKQKLGLAERHHKKLVKKIRNEASALLQAESNIYGKYLNNYAAELTQSTDDLENAVVVAKAALAKAEAAPSSPNDWRDPDVEIRAKLGAQVASAERTVKKAQRRKARDVREAEDRSEETMEDEAQKLGMKVGDMTPLIDEAKKTLEATAEKAAAVKVAGKATTKTAVTAKVNLKALEDNVATATKANLAKTKDANKKLDGFLSKTDKDVAVGTAKIQQDLEKGQTIEIEKVLGHKKAEKKVASTKKAVVSKKVAKKATASKKAAVAKNAVAPKVVAKAAVKAAVAKKVVAAKVLAKASPAKVAVKAVKK